MLEDLSFNAPIELLYATGFTQICLQIFLVVIVVMIGRLCDQLVPAVFVASAFLLMAARRITAVMAGIERPEDFVVLVDNFVLPFLISLLLTVGAVALYEDLRE